MGNLTIDLNCDMGEGCGSDAEMMKYISSASIACGYHAGDRELMRTTIELAIEHGVAVGAHPSYLDRKNFGRTAMSLPPMKVYEIVSEQINELAGVAKVCGTRLNHVKPHGALYNQAATDAELAAAIAQAVVDIDNSLALFGLSGSFSIKEAKKLGLRTASEVFADRTYQNDGSLTPRTSANALIDDPEKSSLQSLDMVKYGRVRSVDAIMVAIKAETICLHGDGSNALRLAIAIRQAFEKSGIAVSPVKRA